MSDGGQANLETPRALRRWFFVHFLLDILFALPLLIAPRPFLTLLGWQAVDPVSARLVAAALFGIGIESFLARRATLSAFPALLELKILWSSAAVVGLVVSIFEGAHGTPWPLWGFLAIFVAFNLIWSWWLKRVKELLKDSE